MRIPRGKPLADRILVLPLDPPAKVGELFIPAGAQELPFIGKVLKVGPGRKNEDGKVQELSISEGEYVLFSKYAGRPFPWGRKRDGSSFELRLLREEEVDMVVDEEDLQRFGAVMPEAIEDEEEVAKI